MFGRSLSALSTGIILTLLACLVFATQDSISKQLMVSLTVIQVIWGRYIFQAGAITSYLAYNSGMQFLRTRHPFLQIARGMAQVGTTCFVYYSLPHVPIGDVTAIVFCSPIIVTVLSVIILKERIGKHRIAAVCVGFIGVYLIILPGSGETSIYHLLTFCGAFTNATYMLMTRRLAGPEEAAATQFNTSAIGLVIFTVLILFGDTMPPLTYAPIFLVIGGLAALGHFAMVRALSFAPASMLSPYLYAQVMVAAIFSVLWFGDSLRPTMVTGATLLILSGVYIWWREQVRGRA